MTQPNVVLLVVDSLRAQSISGREFGAPPTPFLASLSERTISFERAYSAECWTLPSHMSMFTGLLPSEHGAHFQSMAYGGVNPTIAEVFARNGYRTEVITRNSIFDGSIPGVLRGFENRSQPMADLRLADAALHAVLALAKPRVRRLIRESGFFHSTQKTNRDFLIQLVRMGMPADRLALNAALESMSAGRRSGKPYFLFLNLYDVHAPYSPSEVSAIPPLSTLSGLAEALSLPTVLPKVSSHAYLRAGFRISDRSRRMLLRRYHRAIELMDEKLAEFHHEACQNGLLDDTVLVITSDHGEGFGEHGLYLHDASLYETHLHVPLWVHFPDSVSERVEDVVTTRDLFGLLKSIAMGGDRSGTLLDAEYRRRVPFALAEHFHYGDARSVLPRYRHNLVGVVGRRKKVVRRGSSLEVFDREQDPGELSPEETTPKALRRLLAGEERRGGRGEWEAERHLLQALTRSEAA